jgi:YVTN family beta-propeller protein
MRGLVTSPFVVRKIAVPFAVAATLVGAVATPAAANSAGLDLPGYGAIAVDQAHKHLFVSGGPSSNGVAVTDFSGHQKKVIDQQYGATGLALSADGARLYVALAAGDAISVIDTKTLKETTRYGTGARTCPTTLARVGDLIWFGHGCGDVDTGGIGRLDPTVTPPAIALNQQGTARFDQPPLLASATATGPLVAGRVELSLSTVYVYAVDGGALTERTSSQAPGSNLADAAVSADGSTLYTACRSRSDVPAYETTAFAGRGVYSTGYYPVAAAPSPDGKLVGLGIQNPADDVVVYKLGATDPKRHIDLTDDVLAPRGLAWSADSKTLFVVTQPVTGGAPTVHAVSNL